MRILQICDSASGGGLEVYFVRLVNSLTEQRRHVLCKRDFFVDRGIEGSRVYSFREALKLDAPDIIHVHRSADLWKGVLIKRLTKAPLLFTNHMGCGVSKKDGFHRLVYSQVDHILAISNAVKEELLDCLPVGEERISVLYPGIDVERFTRKRKPKGDPISVGCSSRIEPAKGQWELLSAFNSVADDFPGARLRLAGRVMDGSYLATLEHAGSERMEYSGVLQDVRPFLEGLDIYAFPSHGEAFGLSLCEAMAMELACIAYGERGVKEIIEDGRSGILVDRGDQSSLASSLRRLMEDGGLRETLGSEARRRVCENFSWILHFEKLMKVYRRLIGKPSRKRN